MTDKNKKIACLLMKRFSKTFSTDVLAGMILAGIYGAGDSKGVTLKCVKDYMGV